MDIRGFLHFIAENFNLVAGTTLALFFLSGMILLVRSIGEGAKEVTGGGNVDLGAIEGAMKRVLATQPVSVVATVGGERARPQLEGGEGDSGLADQLRADLTEREETIQNLKNEIESMKTKLDAAGSAPAGQSGNDASAKELAETRAKMEELQARLAEYEIIEDDIADLSLYKDENSKLQAEVAQLKEQLANSARQPAPVAAAPMPPVAAPIAMPDVQLPEDDPVEAPAAASEDSAQAKPALNFVKSDKFELDFNDDIMQEFASAVNLERAPEPDPSLSVPEEPIDPQAMIDAMLAKAEASSAPPAAPAPPVDDAQAAIDALFASAQAAEEASPPAVAAAPAAPVTEAEAEAQPEAEAEADLEAMLGAETVSDETQEAEPAQAAEEIMAVASDEISDDQSHEVTSEALAGSPDPDKLLTEVEGLAPTVEDTTAALEESLDTDKLLAEMGSIKEEGKEEGPTSSPASAEASSAPPAVAATPAEAPAAPAPAQAEAPAAPTIKMEPLSLDDDLLAEFKDAAGGDSNS